MLTHKIIKAKPSLHIVQNRSSVTSGVNSQAELDAYIAKYPWAKPGSFVCHDHTHQIRDWHSIHYVAKVVTNFSELGNSPYYEVFPRCALFVCMNLDPKGETTWQRMDNLKGYRPLTEAELAQWVTSNDNLQDRLKLWKQKNGFGDEAEASNS